MSNEKIEAFWEDATAEGVAGIAKTGKPIAARVRDEDTEDWRNDLLAGWKLSRLDPGEKWIDADGVNWKQCQVYREPSWWTEKPDPGPEHRLLGKFPDEEPQLGDSVFCPGSEIWLDLEAPFEPGQRNALWYRRRIEAMEPKFAVGQTVRVVGPKGSDARHWSEKMNKHIGRTSPIKAREKKDDRWFYELGCSAIWSFDEDYIEPVEPEPKHYVLRVGDSANIPNGQTITITAKGFEVTQ